jgi:hypothetical protein
LTDDVSRSERVVQRLGLPLVRPAFKRACERCCSVGSEQVGDAERLLPEVAAEAVARSTPDSLTMSRCSSGVVRQGSASSEVRADRRTYGSVDSDRCTTPRAREGRVQASIEQVRIHAHKGDAPDPVPTASPNRTGCPIACVASR